MLYKIGTLNELNTIDLSISECVIEKLAECISILDDAYGGDRDYLKQGGYVVVAENYDDVLLIKDLVDYENYRCEWLDKVSDYIIAMYLLGDDFTIVVAMPARVAPNTILQKTKGEFYNENN
ncbi:MAG: hypothetical protein IKW59_05960 [Clostridia bacterium]|nr:hypothetical protein [Clostridia bacterium]